MSDELTPEEKAAFESLPRERMPAGLEAKVVDAMREHGFLAKDGAKKRRAIELSGGRVAGVLAASVALVIVAYSVGVHRGDGREMIMPTETVPPAELREGALQDAVAPSPEVGRAVPHSEPPATAEQKEAVEEQDQAVRKDAATAEPTQRDDDSDALGAKEPARPSEVDLHAKRIRENLSRSLQEPKRRDESALQASGRPSAPSASMEAFSLSKPTETVTFLWGGETYQLEADSVRVVEDERGRTLHIYTSDGVIRIRLAE